MTTSVPTLWRIDYTNGDLQHIAARTAREAIADSHDPDADMDRVVRLTVAQALTDAYHEEWDTDAGLAAVIVRPGRMSGHDGWLILPLTVVLYEDGELDAAALANFRTLRRRWAGLDSVRFDNGRVELCDSGPAPGDLIQVLTGLRDNEVLEPATAAEARDEIALNPALDSLRTTRIAVRTAENPGWQIHEVPVSVLGNFDAEASAVPGSICSAIIVVDAVPGFAAGCSTWSEADPQERDRARREHWSCEHEKFGPAT